MMDIMTKILFPALLETIYMVLVSTLFAVIIGFFPAIILILTDAEGLKPNKVVFKTLDFIINILRSLPFIILMVAVMGLTKLITGTTLGTTAAIVPLTIGAAPFAARVIESSLREVDRGVIEASKAFGATNRQIIFNVMFKEAMPSIVRGITLTVISVIGYSAMAGSIGGGGLGYVAVAYGFIRTRMDITFYTVIILIILVQILQGIGDLIYKKMTN